ncbi:hypothetical protein ASH01_12975 [Terrabacter sp. Soil811]|uniref:hypothetical protein n=1 Tax=Terrabacter sp. Soil811 TaxID=1736419 RepID=UPI0007010BED|nr:hypothetical protein [Terrabacter sp. Soil811]KRF44865.1 hypothetical protein ASH01_12975 [Terrabacter sp. Soil811]
MSDTPTPEAPGADSVDDGGSETAVPTGGSRRATRLASRLAVELAIGLGIAAVLVVVAWASSNAIRFVYGGY